MSSGSANARRMRVWPAVVAPLGLTMLLGIATWLFYAKVDADGKQATAEALRLEGYARLEAGELAGRAGALAQTFIGDRLARRADQEKNMRVELRGVVEAVYRVLTAGLEKTRAAGAASRDVGAFPAGFEGLRVYLELAGSPTDADAPVQAMRACLPELSALVPAGCSLAVVENNFEEILSLGGGAVPDNARSESMTREFIWGDGAASRHWTLQVKLSEADAYPLPDAAELAGHLSRALADIRLDGVAWRGWLVDRAGQAVASFPAQDQGSPTRRGGDAPPFIDMPGEWVEIDGSRLVWQERSGKPDGVELAPAVAVAIDRPSPPPVWHEELNKDRRWSATLVLLTLLSVATWVWFIRAVALARRGVPSRQAAEGEKAAPPPAGTRAAVQAAAQAAIAAAQAGKGKQPQRQRLVRDESKTRSVPDVQDVIVAEISDDGEVVVEAEFHPPAPRPRLVIPSGSLMRLQERHRGGKGRKGSRILDHARSPLLRELAGRVRPVVGASAASAESRRSQEGGGRTTERIIPSRNAGGWDKVAE